MKSNYHPDYESGKIYHIYNHASSVDNLFQEENDCFNFLNKFYKYFGSCFDVLAYCLMPNHYHLIVKVKDKVSILNSLKNPDSKATIKLISGEIKIDEFIRDQFRRFHSSISLKYNLKYKRKGQLFLNRHKNVLVSSNNLIEKICYVHHNPIHHDFCNDYLDWKYSSYQTYFEGKKSKLATHLTYIFFGNLKDFIEIHEQYKNNFPKRVEQV